jgi:hypothetical protein
VCTDLQGDRFLEKRLRVASMSRHKNRA